MFFLLPGNNTGYFNNMFAAGKLFIIITPVLSATADNFKFLI